MLSAPKIAEDLVLKDLDVDLIFLVEDYYMNVKDKALGDSEKILNIV